MDLGFKKCREESNKQCPVAQIFSEHFGTKFVRSTFYDHCRHWMSVHPSARKRYIDYGHTEKGHWSVFFQKEIRGKRVMGQ